MQSGNRSDFMGFDLLVFGNVPVLCLWERTGFEGKQGPCMGCPDLFFVIQDIRYMSLRSGSTKRYILHFAFYTVVRRISECSHKRTKNRCKRYCILMSGTTSIVILQERRLNSESRSYHRRNMGFTMPIRESQDCPLYMNTDATDTTPVATIYR